MDEMHMRNILRLMSYGEWKSFEIFLSSLEKNALTKVKRADSDKEIFRGQGALHVLDDIDAASSRFKQLLTEISNG